VRPGTFLSSDVSVVVHGAPPCALEDAWTKSRDAVRKAWSFEVCPEMAQEPFSEEVSPEHVCGE